MPVLKISFGNRSVEMINYLLSQNEVGNRVQALAGNVIGRDAATVEREFKETRDQFGQHEGRQYYHVALSFERGDLGDMVRSGGSPDHAQISLYGDEWAKEAGIADRHEYLVVVHGEKEHPHAHVIWNATGFDGRKYHNDKHNLNRLRDVNDRLARRHGIERELDRVRDPHRPSDRFIRQAERGGSRYSWKLDIQDRIREAARRAFSEKEFKARLKELGVDLRVRGDKYSYKMTDAYSKSRTVREKRLGESYERAELIEKFARQKEQLSRDPDGYRGRLRSEESSRYVWQRDLRSRISLGLRNSETPAAFKDRMTAQGVDVSKEAGNRYHFTFQDRLGLIHEAVPADRLVSGGSLRIEARFQENEGLQQITERLAAPSGLAKSLGREAGGLVATLMREVDQATRDPHAVQEDWRSARWDDLRAERSREPLWDSERDRW